MQLTKFIFTQFLLSEKKTSISRCNILHFFEFIPLIVFSYSHIKTENLYVN